MGALFGTQEEGVIRTELIVFLTPRVIGSAEDARDVTLELRSRLWSLRPGPHATAGGAPDATDRRRHRPLTPAQPATPPRQLSLDGCGPGAFDLWRALLPAWHVLAARRVAWSLPESLVRGRDALPQARHGVTFLSLGLPLLCGAGRQCQCRTIALPGILVLGWTLVALAISRCPNFRPSGLPDVASDRRGHSLFCVDQCGTAVEPQANMRRSGRSVACCSRCGLFCSWLWLPARFRAVRGIEGLGLGDAKLLAAAGAWVGLAALPSVILLAAVAALTVTVLAAPFCDGQRRWRGPRRFHLDLIWRPATWIVALYGPLALS